MCPKGLKLNTNFPEKPFKGTNNFRLEETEIYGVRVCVCVCVCVCVFMLFHLLLSSVCTTSLAYVRSSNQRSFVVSISVTALCQVPSSPYLKMSYFTSKDENSSPTLLERKRYDIMCTDKDDIY